VKVRPGRPSFHSWGTSRGADSIGGGIHEGSDRLATPEERADLVAFLENLILFKVEEEEED